MINALVVEDEVAAAKRLVKMINEIDPEINIIKVTDSIESTVNWLNNNPKPDLIFLDIHLADGSSFKIFERHNVTSPVVFTTAYDQYAIQAFKVNSIDYLLKPIKKEELAFSITKYKQTINTSVDFLKLIDEIKKQQIPRWQQRFIVQFADKLKSIDINDVAYFVAQEKSVFLITKQGPGYAVDYTLEKLESLLNPEHFFRINRKFIVNFTSINTMHFYTKSRVKLELIPRSDVEVIVSTERSGSFKEWLNR